MEAAPRHRDRGKANPAKRVQEPDYRGSAETRRLLEREQAEFRTILTGLGWVK